MFTFKIPVKSRGFYTCTYNLMSLLVEITTGSVSLTVYSKRDVLIMDHILQKYNTRHGRAVRASNSSSGGFESLSVGSNPGHDT